MVRFLLCFAMACAALPAFAQGEKKEEAPAPTPPAIREIVEAGNHLFMRAFEARDARGLADLYTEDARVIPPGGEAAEGREAIAKFWAGVMQETSGVRLETLSAEAAGDLAFEEGVGHFVANDGSESSARYVVVWKRVGRRWHLHRDIWNAGPAPAAEAPAPTPEPVAPEPEAPAAETPPPDDAPIDYDEESLAPDATP